jgi:hypothetical protein
MRAILLAALVAAGPASADLMFKQGDTQIRLAEEVCRSERIKFMAAAAGVETPYAGLATFGNYIVGLCWGRVEDKFVIVDEDGDGAYLPATAFKVENGV